MIMNQSELQPIDFFRSTAGLKTMNKRCAMSMLVHNSETKL